MRSFYSIVPALGLTAAICWAVPATAISAIEVSQIAKQSTVQINNSNSPGSGVIIQKNGNIYTVLTAAHVLRNSGERYQIVTPDGKSQNLTKVRFFPNQVDLAVAEFTSPQSYEVGKLAKDSNELKEGSIVYVSGFPSIADLNQALFNFTEGKVTANSSRPLREGYSLVYSNSTLPGHSGGPVWNQQGEIVAIHGKGDVDKTLTASAVNPNIRVKTGFNLGIAVATFRSGAAAVGLNGIQPSTIVRQPTTVDDLLVSGLAKLDSGEYADAIEDFERAVQADPKRAVAYLYRGTARRLNLQTQSKVAQQPSATYQIVLADFRKAYQLKPSSTWALEGAGATYIDMGNYPEALIVLNTAIAAKPTENAYSLRALAYHRSGDLAAALADYTQAIKIQPRSAFYYAMRASVYEEQQDYQLAIVDYGQAIRLQPQAAIYYYQRGLAKAKIGNVKGAIQDLEVAAPLFKKYQNTVLRRQTWAKIQELRRQQRSGNRSRSK